MASPNGPRQTIRSRHPHAYGEHTMANIVKDVDDSARTLGMQLQLVPADGPDDISARLAPGGRGYPPSSK
jgi:3-dehydroquinate dehydratase